MRKIEHLGIAVKDLDKSKELFSKLLGQEAYKEENVESEGVTTSFFMVGDTKVELLQAMRSDSPIARYLSRRDEGLHHIAFEVDNIFSEMDRLEKAGFEILNHEPKEGADHKLVVFLHPRTTNGVLVELCQEKKQEDKGADK